MSNRLESSTLPLVSLVMNARNAREGRRLILAAGTSFRVTRLLLTSIGLVSCQSLLDFGPEPTLRTSSEEPTGGSGGSRSHGTGGMGRGGSSVDEANETTGNSQSGRGGAQETTVSGNDVEGSTNVGGTEGSSLGNGGNGNGGQSQPMEVAGGGTIAASSSGGGRSFGTGGSETSGGTSGQDNGTGGSTSSAGGDTGESSTVYSCSVDVTLATHDCQGPVQVTQLGASMGTLNVNMTGYTRLFLRVEVLDPTGYVLDLGDSPCVDGGGGDCGWFSNDAELDVQRNAEGSANLTLYASDLISRSNGTVVLGSIPNFFNATGPSVRTLVISDGMVCTDNAPYCWESPALLRIGTLDAENPTPDDYWYIGLNRVVWNLLRDPPRVGSGVRKATLKLQ